MSELLRGAVGGRRSFSSFIGHHIFESLTGWQCRILVGGQFFKPHNLVMEGGGTSFLCLLFAPPGQLLGRFADLSDVEFSVKMQR